MTERGARKGPVTAGWARASSSQICAEVLSTLDQIYATEGPDEPDLGLNVAYMTARTSILRLASARPWDVTAPTASLIRQTIASISAMRRPQELEAQLLSFPVWVFRLLDRRRIDRRAARSVRQHRRIGDRVLHRSHAARLVRTPTRPAADVVRTATWD